MRVPNYHRAPARRIFMRRITTVIFALLVCIAAADPLLFSQDRSAIHGRVVDSQTDEPVPAVNIVLHGTGSGTASDDDGYFRLADIPPGTYRIVFTHINYIPTEHVFTFRPGVDQEFRVFLDPRPIELDEVEVVDTLERTDRGYMHVFHRQELREGGQQSLGRFLQNNLTRVDVHEQSGFMFIRLQLRRLGNEDGRSPYPLIIIDNIRMGNDPMRWGPLLHPEDIEKLEVIRPPLAQVLYGSEASSGVIVIETLDNTRLDHRVGNRLLHYAVGGILIGVIIAINLLF
jgi:TonB-dependent starch-binding outer membrane protein SusC